jgi:hypothetical protein
MDHRKVASFIVIACSSLPPAMQWMSISTSNHSKQNHAIIAAAALLDLGANENLSKPSTVGQILNSVFDGTPLKIVGDAHFATLVDSASTRATKHLRAALEGKSDPTDETDDQQEDAEVQPRGLPANRSRGGGAGARGGHHHSGQQRAQNPQSNLTQDNVAKMLARIEELERRLAAANAN